MGRLPFDTKNICFKVPKRDIHPKYQHKKTTGIWDLLFRMAHFFFMRNSLHAQQTKVHN